MVRVIHYVYDYGKKKPTQQQLNVQDERYSAV